MLNPQFGFCAPIFAAPGEFGMRTPNYESLDPMETLSLCRDAEALGYDTIWVVDHLMIGKDQAILEGWTTLAALAGMTQRVRLGMVHHANLMRHASMTAKMTATLDQISGGRFIHFFHPAAREAELTAYGLTWPDSDEERAERMVEALELTLKLWTADGPVDYQGRYYQLDGAICRPPPIQKPHPPVWLGLVHPIGFAATARYAQGWNAMPVPMELLRTQLDQLRAACKEHGRVFEELELSYETQILIGKDINCLRRALRSMGEKGDGEVAPDVDAFINGEYDEVPESLSDTFLMGTPDEVAAQIRNYIELGFSHFMLWFMDVPSRAGIELFADAVMPQFSD